LSFSHWISGVLRRILPCVLGSHIKSDIAPKHTRQTALANHPNLQGEKLKTQVKENAMYALTGWNPNSTLLLFNREEPQPMMMEPTIEEQMDHFIHYPEQFSPALINILQQNDAQQIIAVLKAMLQKVETHPQTAKQYAYQLVMAISNPIANHVLEKQPELFAQLLKCLEENQKKEILKHLTRRLENWKGRFVEVFLALDRFWQEKRPQDTPAGSFLVNLMSFLSPHRAKQWIKHCASELPYADLAFLIITLEGKMGTFALNASICSLDFNLSEDGFLSCFEALALQTNYPNLVRSVLNKILQRFYQAGQFDKIIKQFHQLSLSTQVCLLDAMGPPKQNQIFRQHYLDLSLLAVWMDGLFYYQKKFNIRIRTIRQICDSLHEGALTEFIQMLNDQRSKVGAYFLMCLSSQHFQEFVFTVPYQIRSELLSNSLADATTASVLHAIREDTDQELLIYEEMRLNLENPIIPIETSCNLSHCFELLQQMSLAPDLAADYIPFIACIPPVLIGVLAINLKRRNVLIKLAPQLSDEQLKFLACVMPRKSFAIFLEKTWSSLNTSQYMALLEILTPNKLMYYVKEKNEELKAINCKFHEKYKSFQADLEKIEEGQFISSASFAQLEKRSNDLFLLTRRPSMLDYHCLRLFLQRPHIFDAFPPQYLAAFQQIVQELQHIMNHLNSKRSWFEGQHALIRIKLSELECSLEEEMEEAEEVDLTMVLYEGFWSLVREGILPYLGISLHSQLGITHGGQLNLVGIQSNADLHLLGISPDLQNRVHRLAEEIKNLQGSKTSNFDQLWETFISIKTPPKELESVCTSILLALNIQQRKPLDLKNICLIFGQKLMEFKHLSQQDQNNLKKEMQKLESCQPQIIRELALTFFELVLMVLRSQYPLFCLQRYLLDNKNLKQAWEKLHSHKCFSLTHLYERGLIKMSADILKLESIADKLSKCSVCQDKEVY
jgi:hypothetical protein